jgi:hypothetical protein
MVRTACLVLAFLLPALPTLHSEKVDNRDFAIDTCYPTPNAIQLAETLARRFWAKRAPRYGPEPRYLAVETSKIFPGEVQDLYPKLINSETTASFFSRPSKDIYSNLQLLGIMIYDTKTGRFVSVTYPSIPPIPEEWRDGDLTSHGISVRADDSKRREIYGHQARRTAIMKATTC